MTELTKALRDFFRGKRVLLLGMGREGRSSLRWLGRWQEQLGIAALGIADRKEQLIEEDDYAGLPVPEQLYGESYLGRCNAYDIILKSPGISLRDYTGQWAAPGVLAAWPDAEISGQIDLLLRFGPREKLIGISGTKGKTTTATLTARILETAGFSTVLAGNIGLPVLDMWDEIHEADWCVLELSSHQLQFVQASPAKAALTNFYEEHLDHYIDYDEYIWSKLNLPRFQQPGDLFVLNTDDEQLTRLVRPLAAGRLVETGAAAGSRFDGLNEILAGSHHAVDMAIAAALAEDCGAEEADARAAFSAFTGIPHRCERLGTWRGITFYNDSIATIPAATLLAIEQLRVVDTLLVGGMDRGLDYSQFLRDLEATPVRHFICLPDTGEQVYAYFAERDKERVSRAETLDEAVRQAYDLTRPGTICLLSPAASSYHRWSSFEARGDEFRRLVRGYGDV